MKIIELRRHGKNDKKKNLTYEGYVQARAIGERDLRGEDFDCVFTSHLARAIDTARAFAEGAGDFTVEKFIPLPGLHTGRTDTWKIIIKKAKENGKTKGDIASHIEQYPAFVNSEAERLEKVLKEIIDQIPDGGKALVIGHSPIIECLVYGITGELIDPLKECEGVILEISNDGRHVKLVKEIRLKEEEAV